MYLQYFFDEQLAQASYIVGCQATGEAIIIDPSRHITPYITAAKAQNLRIVAAAETHIHADIVSGGRELAEQTGASLYLSHEGGADWQYQNIPDSQHVALRDGDTFHIGNISFDVMHTPGHTPESLSFILTDHGGMTDEPMGIFTGDFVFVGDIGRPDLLEKAAGETGSAETSAQDMFASLQRFKTLPDHLQVWPGHGAGSACGKAMDAVPSSTVGFEKIANWALTETDEARFVATLLDGQPEPPKYFAHMKRINREGPALLSTLTAPVTLSATPETLYNFVDNEDQVLDVRPAAAFAAEHVPGTLNIPFNRSFSHWAGWLLDEHQPLYLIVEDGQAKTVIQKLYNIGIDNIAGYFTTDIIDDYATAGYHIQSYQEATPADIAADIQAGRRQLIDVRQEDEWQKGHIPEAQHIMLGYLAESLHQQPNDKPIVVQCQSGGRSAIAASLLQKHGFPEVTNMTGGFSHWQKESLPQTNEST